MEDYDSYFAHYISLARNEDVTEALRESASLMESYFNALTEEDWKFQYAAGKWSLKDMLQHIIDTERVMAYRALSFARGIQDPLPGFDQDLFAQSALPINREGEALFTEYLANRVSNIAMFSSFNVKHLERSGSFSGMRPLSVKAIGLLIAGHDLHHLMIARERYIQD